MSEHVIDKWIRKSMKKEGKVLKQLQDAVGAKVGHDSLVIQRSLPNKQIYFFKDKEHLQMSREFVVREKRGKTTVKFIYKIEKNPNYGRPKS